MKRSQYQIKPSTLKQNLKWSFKSRGYIPDDFKPKTPIFFRHLLYRYKLHYTTLILVVGQVRSGKSYCAMKIAERYAKELGQKFDVKKQLSFDLLPFLEWSRTAENSVFVLDEVGVSLAPTLWYDPLSIVVKNFIQTQGFRRNVLILCLPNASFLLKNIRFMMNYIIETKFQGFGYVKRLSMDNVRSKGYYSNMGIIRYRKPKKVTYEEYESIKKKWNDAKLDDDIRSIKDIDIKKKQKAQPLVFADPVLHQKF